MTEFRNDEVKLTKDDYDPLTPEVYIENQNALINSVEYQEIQQDYRKRMKPLLENKDKKDLETQCANEQCTNSNKDLFGCQPIKRIENVLRLYNQLLNENKLWKKVAMGPMITSDHYGHQQLYNDFLHVKLYHIDADNKRLLRIQNRIDYDYDNEEEKDVGYQELAKKICEYFAKRYECKNVEKCEAFTRHYRDREDKYKENSLFHRVDSTASKKAAEIRNDKEKIIQEECDKIHCYFLQFGCINTLP